MNKNLIKKIAKQNNIDLTLIKINKLHDGTLRLEDNIQNESEVENYNIISKKLVNALNCNYWSFTNGYNANVYELGLMSESTKLAFKNID